jgi:nucleotide-binding universal stress UspA family protein
LPKLIVIAVDGSPAADHATAIGLDLAVAQKAGVLFVHFSPIWRSLLESEPEHGPSQETIEREDPVLGAAARAARARGVDFELELADAHGSSDTADSIVGLAEGRDADLIVVGTRGRGAITGAVLGSVSHQLLGISRLPVVVAHA